MPAEGAGTFERIKALVIRRTMHHYYDDKDALLRERVQRRMARTGFDQDGYLRLLEGGAGSEAEWAALEAEVTIGETFFFRYAEQFAALSNTILPALIGARASHRRLRIWSAGCSTGAEPYSVAILLHRLLGPSLADWSISILGTDISDTALEAARTGVYGEWALRSLSDTERRRDFVPLPGTGGRRWELRPAYRAMVRFERQNLLGLLDGTIPAPSDLDLVLCRNVLIYFHRDRVKALVGRFGDCLAPDGWLLLGHAEAAIFDIDALRVVPLDGTMAWRRADDPPAPAPVLAATWPVSPPTRPLTRAGPAADVPAATPPDPDGEPDAVAEVRAIADAGDPQTALELCRRKLEQHPTSPVLFFYAGLLRRAVGDEVLAEADFRRAIYLSNQFAMAHYHLGLLLTEAGRVEPGRRAISEAGRIARGLPDGQVLEGGDGMTASRLRLLTRLDWLPGGAVGSGRGAAP